MATKFDSATTLKALISHHVAMINRFEAHSFEEFALLFLKIDNVKNINSLEIKKSIQIIFRDSDIIFEHDGNYIILLPKTNWNGAIELIQGLQNFLNQEFLDSVITYPDDGKNADELINSLSKMVEKYYKIELNF